ncbi:MAG: FtsQ-type POTRA domain-containing protein [Rhodothermales bacterium]|nr:FtsQ-type POTRA domain-containing protein [Rhodothermales bacterium]
MINRQATGIVSIAVVLVAAAVGVLGYRHLMTIPLERVVVSGNEHAAEADLIALAELDTSRTLYRIDAELTADRVARHPWVETAGVLRLPTGTMRIRIDERRPVVQVLDWEGRVAWYLDRTGAMMPVTARGGVTIETDTTRGEPEIVPHHFDVPVLSGLRDEYHPMHTVSSEPLRAFLDVLADVPDETGRKISEVILVRTAHSEDIQVRLVPTEKRPGVRVRLGSEEFEDRIRSMEAFWNQQIVRNPDVRYELIDLRFDGRIVSRQARDVLTP